MFEFCPYDFKRFDKENLAYEIKFSGKWNWEDVKKKTVIGSQYPNEKEPAFIDKNDVRRAEHYIVNETVKVIMLLETTKKGGKNGLQLLKELIEHKNEQLDEKEAMDALKEAEETAETNEDFEYERDGFAKKDSIIRLISENVNGIEIFRDRSNEEVIMRAIPCCPKCHQRLPIGWFKADDFAAVSLMAPSGGGKTTFLLSMMNKEWAAFQNLEKQIFGEHKIRITSAHYSWDKNDGEYFKMQEQAEKLCKKNGLCPQNTNRENWIAPVFLNVSFDRHTLIVGIYDNAGENLRQLNIIENENLQMLLDKMYAEMFLFDPKDLNIALPRQSGTAYWEALDSCKMMPIEEQGPYQERSRMKSITGAELLEHLSQESSDGNQDLKAFEVYQKHLNVLQQQGRIYRLEKMNFFGILIKSDLIEQCEQIRAEEKYNILFDRDCMDDMFDEDSMSMRSQKVEDLIRQFDLFGSKKIQDFEKDFSKDRVSWHCISALGCATDKPGGDGKLLGNYAPIRVAEPLITCILKRVADNGWI